MKASDHQTRKNDTVTINIVNSIQDKIVTIPTEDIIELNLTSVHLLEKDMRKVPSISDSTKADIASRYAKIDRMRWETSPYSLSEHIDKILDIFCEELGIDRDDISIDPGVNRLTYPSGDTAYIVVPEKLYNVYRDECEGNRRNMLKICMFHSAKKYYTPEDAVAAFKKHHTKHGDMYTEKVLSYDVSDKKFNYTYKNIANLSAPLFGLEYNDVLYSGMDDFISGKAIEANVDVDNMTITYNLLQSDNSKNLTYVYGFSVAEGRDGGFGDYVSPEFNGFYVHNGTPVYVASYEEAEEVQGKVEEYLQNDFHYVQYSGDFPLEVEIIPIPTVEEMKRICIPVDQAVSILKQSKSNY